MKKGLKAFSFYLIIPAFLAMIFNKFVDNHLVFANILFYLLVLLFFLFCSRKDIKRDFNDIKKNFKKYILVILKWTLIEFGLMIVSNYLILLFIDSLPNNELSNREFLMSSPILAISYLLLIAPMIEEYVFRYSFKNIKNYYLFTFITSLLFASLHLLSINNITHIWFLIPYFAMSVGFGTIYYKCQNYFTSTIAHIIHNALCVIIILV